MNKKKKWCLPILDLALFDEEHIDFTVCCCCFFNNMSDSSQNPPMPAARELKTVVEGVNLAQMWRQTILESRPWCALARKTNKSTRVRWFTTMVGVKATLKMAKKCLREMKETTKIRETAFVQDGTRRWGRAWSFERAKTFGLTST